MFIQTSLKPLNPRRIKARREVCLDRSARGGLHAATRPTVLRSAFAIPRFTKIFVVTTDASLTRSVAFLARER